MEKNFQGSSVTVKIRPKALDHQPICKMSMKLLPKAIMKIVALLSMNAPSPDHILCKC